MGCNREEHHFLTGATCRSGTLRNQIIIRKWHSGVSRLKPRIYLVSGASTIQGGYRYTTSPCPISVPHLNAQETVWNYNVTAIPKIEQLPSDAEGPNAPSASDGKSADEATARPFGLSKTGDDIPLLALAAFSCMAVCRSMRRNLARGEATTSSDTTTPVDNDLGK